MFKSLRNPKVGSLALAGLALSVVACGARALPNAEAPPPLPELARAAFAQCGVDGDKVNAIWEEYRAERPYHAQQVAASEPLAGGCRVLILSEPPADVTIATLGEAHPALNAFVPRRHGVGFDGWTEDLVGVVPPMSPDDLAELTSDLHIALFGSAYRARLTPIKARPKWNGALDIEVRPAEVYNWVFGEDSLFWSLDGGPARHAEDLLDPRQTGVYVSTRAGVVLWSLPRTGSFDEQKANVRMFGLESDLLLGAVADEDSVLVIGRERVAPEDVLPPLRFETVKLLATTPLAEFAQSYERNQLFAGPLKNKDDWAPILLSAPLVDSELGSVLDITDQMLKRWSLNGTVDYARFHYPREPARWAFSKPIDQELGADSLTFNWNTSASGALVEVSDNRSLYWMNRTGALHVSYLPGDKPDARTASYEETARDFFARQNDPYLVRAVQYTALFQAFRQLGVSTVGTGSTAESMIDVSAATAVLEDAGTSAFQRLTTESNDDLTAAAKRYVARGYEGIDADRLLQQIIDETPYERRAEIGNHILNASASQAQEIIAKVSQRESVEQAGLAVKLRDRLKATDDPAAPRHLAIALTHLGSVSRAMRDPGGWLSLSLALQSEKAQAKAAEITAAARFLMRHDFGLQHAASWRDAARALTDVDALAAQYSAVSGARATASRIRTPTIVRSHSRKLMAQGGHNVGSWVPSLIRPVEPPQLSYLGFNQQRLVAHEQPLVLRSRSEALGELAARPPSISRALPGQRPTPLPTSSGGWAFLPEESQFNCGKNCMAVTPLDRDAKATSAGDTPLRNRFKIDVDGSVSRAGSTSDIADSAVRRLAQTARQKGSTSAKIDIALLDADMTFDEALGVTKNIHKRLAKRSLGADDSYVLHRSDRPIALDDYDLRRATVSEPIRDGDRFTITVSVPLKRGRAHSLVMRLVGKGEATHETVTKTQTTLGAGLRTPEEIMRDLKSQLGSKDSDLLLELAVDAQDGRVENTPPLPRYRHGGTPAHSF